MTTMLEKAALAMFRAWNGPEDPHDEEMWAATREDYLTALRAALQAIREPVVDVRMAGRNAMLRSNAHPASDYSVVVGQGFTAMIDAILEEKTA